jgi:O-antigen/teichoic acid export membrane protein
LIVSGQTIIDLLYDRRYEQAGWMLQVIAVALATIPIRLATQCFLALGLSNVYFQLHTIRLIALFVLLPLGYHVFGLNGALWGVVLSYFASLPLTAYYAHSEGLFDLKREMLTVPLVLAGVISGWALNAVVAFATHAIQRG